MIPLNFRLLADDPSVPLFHAPDTSSAQRFARLAERVWQALPGAVPHQLLERWKYVVEGPRLLLKPSLPDYRGSPRGGQVLRAGRILFNETWVREATDEQVQACIAHELAREFEECRRGRYWIEEELEEGSFADRDAADARAEQQIDRLVEEWGFAMQAVRTWKGNEIGPPDARRYPKSARASQDATFRRDVQALVETAWIHQVRRTLESCIPDRTGHNHHDELGHKCRPGGSEPGKGVRPGRSDQATDRGNPDRKPAAGPDRPSERGGRGGRRGDKNSPKRTHGSTGKHRTAGPGVNAEADNKSVDIRSAAGKLRTTIGNQNEVRLAKQLGPGYERLPDSKPMDIVHTDDDCLQHGLEVKTLLTNQTGKIHMSAEQAHRKDEWGEGNIVGITNPTSRPDPTYDADCGRRVHVVVIDNREAYYDSIKNDTNFDDRKLDQLYYARGARPWSTSEMVKCDTPAYLQELATMPEAEWKKVKAKYEGKSYPSKRAHPVVTKIVSGETTKQLRQLYRDRKAKYDYVASRLAHWNGQTDQARSESRRLRRRERRLRDEGQIEAANKIGRKADKAQAKARRSSLNALGAETALKQRKAKLELTRSKLQARGKKVPA